MRRLWMWAGLPLLIILAGGPAAALCEMPRIISSVHPSGSYSYVQTPGIEPSSTTSSVTSEARGVFWALGAGAPGPGGHDSGSVEALSGQAGWLRAPVDYAAYVHTTWAAGGNLVDGCIDDESVTSNCTLVMLSDQSEGHGYFALLSAAADDDMNFSLTQSNNATIDLVSIPKPVATAATSTSETAISAPVTVDAPSGGLYVDSECGTAIAGYKVYGQVVARGAAAPTDRLRTIAEWALADGGALPEI